MNNLARTNRAGTSLGGFHPKLCHAREGAFTRCLALFVMLFCCLSMLRGRAHADDAGERGYDELVHAAIAAQGVGDFAQAYALFQQAHQLHPNARTLRALGVAAFQAGRFVDAITHLEASLSHPEKPLDAVLRAAVSDLLARAKAQVASYWVSAEPDTAVLSVDGDVWRTPSEQPLLLLPGEHVLTLQAEGFEPQSLSLTASAGAAERIRISLAAKQLVSAQKPEPPSPNPTSSATQPSDIHSRSSVLRTDPRIGRRRRASLSLVGVGGAAGLTAVGLWLGAQHRVDVIAEDCRQRPGNGCSSQERDDALGRAHLDVFEVAITSAIVVASASAAGAAGLWLWNRTLVTPHIEGSAHGGLLGLRGRF